MNIVSIDEGIESLDPVSAANGFAVREDLSIYNKEDLDPHLLVTGHHILANLRLCECPEESLINSALFSRFLVRSIRLAGLTVMGSRSHGFGKDCGFTNITLLAESHVSLHTYPEKMSAHFDVFVCHYRNDNTEKAEKILLDIIAFFKPKDLGIRRIPRY